MSTAYSVSEADCQTDRESVLRVWRDNITWWSADEHSRRYDWCLRNPYGPNKIFLVRDSATESVVGTCSLAFRAIECEGRQLAAANVVDMAVDKGHRTVQPALLLARAVAQCLSAEMPLLWGIPNQESLGVFLRAGFTNAGQGETYFRRLSFLPALRRRHVPKPFDRFAAAALDLGLHATLRRPNKDAAPLQYLNAYHPGLAKMLLRKDLRSTNNIVRTPEFLHWAYEHSPYRSYVIAGTGPQNSQDISVAALCFPTDGNAIIDELIYRPVPRLVRDLVAGIIAWAQEQGCSSVRLYLVNADPIVTEAVKTLGFTPSNSRTLIVRRHESLPANFQICGFSPGASGSSISIDGTQQTGTFSLVSQKSAIQD